MIQPPFQIRETSPRLMFQFHFSGAGANQVHTLRVGANLGSVQGIVNGIDHRSFVACYIGLRGGPLICLLASRRSSFCPESVRVSIAASMVGITTPRSRATWLVHFPVPF